MYVLYVDESGSHGLVNDNAAYVLAGVAIHERDVAVLGRHLDELVGASIPPGADSDDFELHAAELRDPDAASPWRRVGGNERRAIRERALELIGSFREHDAERPMRLLVEVLTPGVRLEREAYGRLLNRFDDWLASVEGDEHGIALSDVSKFDRDIQRWADDWRQSGGEWGRLDRLVEVPVFADSKASRLLQAADLVAWSAWRRFGRQTPDRHWWDLIESRVDLVLDRG